MKSYLSGGVVYFQWLICSAIDERDGVVSGGSKNQIVSSWIKECAGDKTRMELLYGMNLVFRVHTP
jgi:hypothetical protein